MNIKKQILYLSFTVFAFHVVWENAQAPLFQGYISFYDHFQVCFLGTLGDVVITLLVYCIVGLLKDNFGWISTLNQKDIIALAIIGFFVAIGIEWRALLFGKWAYSDAMPIVPYLKVGFTPVLQMILLLPLSIYLTKKFTVSKDITPMQ